MEKRILLAFILSFGVLYGFRALYAPTEPQTAVPAPSQPTSEESVPVPAPIQQESANSDQSQATVPVPEGGIRAENPEEFVFDTELYTATVSNVGGGLKSFRLKAYKDANGDPIELIDADGASKVGWPLAVVTGDKAVDEALVTASYVGRRDGQKVEMEFAADGIYVRKSLQFDPAKYDFQLSTSVSKNGNAIPHSVVWQGGFGDQSVTAPDALTKNVVYRTAGEFERVNIDGLPVVSAGEESLEVMGDRVGVEDQYFLAMFLLPKATGPVKAEKRDYARGEEQISTAYVAMPVDSSVPTLVYMGPKDERWLRQSDPQLPAVIDYGFFGVLAQPLIVALLWLNSYIGNFGWAIIILTIVINFVLFPLRLKQQVSMQKMQKIQPQMKTLQDRYKKLKANDPRRAQVQTEMMNLYKEHGVNPMGGCLPLLLQIPFFAAIWTMLSISIELRQAPWMLWITDLSRYDPYYVLPILMAVSMVIMQKMTPTTVDPSQAKIMMIMPLVFAVMFLQAQSGLALYWLTSNVVGIGQQFFMNQYWTPRTEAKLMRGQRRGSDTQ